MKLKYLTKIMMSLLVACTFVACNESDSSWDPYHDWKARNQQWFEQVADTARQAISAAKAKYGKDWEQHCDWRMYKTLKKAQDVNTGKLADSICVKIIDPGTGTLLANYNDTVRLSFRGWLMETQYDNGDGKLLNESYVFTQTYYGDYDPQTAAPSTSVVSAMIEGFQTALQYMPEGADWYVYIPQELGYGKKAESAIPSYSTLLFRINMTGIYPVGTAVPSWKVRKK